MNNIIENNYKSSTSTVGMGATRLGYSDRHPYTVIEVNPNGKECVIQEDKATRTDSNGMSDSQSYAYEPNPNAAKETIRLYKDGHWHIYMKGAGKGDVVMLGRRQKYYDYSF